MEEIPSLGCLLYLAADQAFPAHPLYALGGPFSAKVPGKFTFIPYRDLWASVLAATYLELRDADAITMRRPGDEGFMWHGKPVHGIVVGLAKAAEHRGLAGEVLHATVEATKEEAGEVPLDLALRYLGWGGDSGRQYMQWVTQSELVDLGYMRRSGSPPTVIWRLHRARRAELDDHCDAAVARWRRFEREEWSLHTQLFYECRDVVRPNRS